MKYVAVSLVLELGFFRFIRMVVIQCNPWIMDPRIMNQSISPHTSVWGIAPIVVPYYTITRRENAILK